MNTKRALALLTFIAAFSAAAASAAHPPSTSPREVFDAMRGNFHPEKAHGVNAVYQFEISGPSGGSWAIEVKDDRCRIDKTRIDRPNVTLLASDRDWVALANGRLSGVWAYVTGRLKIRGDQMLARKLDEMFP